MEKSLSARRAWIEIFPVAEQKVFERSLSARRAWIEIPRNEVDAYAKAMVALRKESVDRNDNHGIEYEVKKRRSPQGERG